jgi:hypothetical protein
VQESQPVEVVEEPDHIIVPMAVDPYHPIWPYIRKFISDPRLEYAEGKTQMNIAFDINGHKFKALIEYQDENQSSFQIFKVIPKKKGKK